MQISDPISDLLTRIRNAIHAGHPSVSMPHSKLKLDIARILLKEGYVRDVVQEKDERGHPQIRIHLKFMPETGSAISGLRRISKPGLRRYASATNIPRVLSGLGISIISTSRGILTDRDARKANLGGELLCNIW